MQLGSQAPVPQGNYCYAERCHYPHRSRVYRILWWIRRRCCNGCDDSFKYRKRLKFRYPRTCYQVARGLAKLLLLQVAKSLVLLLLACANNHEGLTTCSSSLLHAMPKYPVRRAILVATFAVLHTVFVKLLRSFAHTSFFFFFFDIAIRAFRMEGSSMARLCMMDAKSQYLRDSYAISHSSIP